MRVWAQSSHCSTCPPRAAVRQLSMADMTLSWPRLTWPALALRHAGPWPRKISATSRIGRDTRAALYAVSYTHLRAHETRHDLVCRLLLEKKKKKKKTYKNSYQQ